MPLLHRSPASSSLPLRPFRHGMPGVRITVLYLHYCSFFWGRILIYKGLIRKPHRINTVVPFYPPTCCIQRKEH